MATSAVTLTPEHQQALTALGIDWKNVDWAKLFKTGLTVIEAILAVLAQQPAPMHAGLKAAGCPDEDCDHAGKCVKAASLALASATESLECAQSCCTG